MTPYKLNKDGIELQACNSVGHYALTIPLLPILKATAALPDARVRIVNVTSDGHEYATPKTVDFSSLEGLNGKDQPTNVRYGNSKVEVTIICVQLTCTGLTYPLQNIYLSDKLREILEGTGIRCFAVHPGAVATELDRG